MSEAKYGEEFIKHELDEAIAVQQSIVEGAKQLSESHPRSTSKKAIKSVLREDEKFLTELRTLGKEHGATGKKEDVALALSELMTETASKAASAESEAYEAQAVLINLKRKQQDSGSAMVKIAREMDDDKMRDAAMQFAKATKASAQELADDLAAFAVEIATMQPATASRASR
jgi:hypothetical protein